MLETIPNRIKIDKYPDGYVITITEKNWTKIGHFATPCYISYGDDTLIELHNDYLINHSNINHSFYEGEAFERLLPQLLEHGKILPRDEENNPIFIDKKEKIG